MRSRLGGVVLLAAVAVGCVPAPETPVTTTSTAPSTTTTMAPLGASDVIDFVEDFAGWLESDDVDALFRSLHPYVVERGGADLCRSFIEEQIIRFEGYGVVGEPIGPTPVRFPEGDAEVWTVPISFVYDGTPFEAEAVVSLESGVGRWFTECR